MAKKLHPKIQELKDRTAGQYLTSRYIESIPKRAGSPVEPKYKDNTRVIEGYLAVWGVKDSYGTIAMRGCFAKSISDRGPSSNAKNKIIHLFMHNMFEPVASYLELEEDDYGLRFAALVDDVEGMPERVLVQTRSGTLNQYSYGFNYVWDKMEYVENRDAVLMHECDLYEGSSVSIKASNPETFTIRTKEDLDNKLIELGHEAEAIISTIPRKHQMEIRQLITSYKSLAELKPLEGKRALDLSIEPVESEVMAVGSYKLDVKQFKS